MDSRIFPLFSIFICIFLSIYPSIGSPKIGEFFGGGDSGKMAKNNHWENWDEENVDGKMADPFSAPNAKKPIEEDLAVGKEPMADGGIGELFERLSRSELIQSIIRMLSQINGRGMGEGGGEGINEEYSREKEQKIERRSAAKSHEKEQQNDAQKMRPSRISQINVNRKLQMDQPIFYIRSPTLVQQQNNKRTFSISESIDSRPMTISKNTEEHFIGTKEQSGGDQMASIQEAIGKEWKHSLFGRSGLLTEIFNFVNDKRKEGLLKQQQVAQIQQAAPNLNADKFGNDFAKILDSLLNKAKTGDFDEPLPEIPFIGICNRLSCGDIYKALDEFRKSEFFSNFQTAISLLNDPKGFDMIGELLANPELLENFTGPESMGELFGSGKKLEEKKTATVEIGENTDAENIGVDFSAYIDGKELSKENRPLPQILTSIDSGSPDYYSSVDEKEGEMEQRKMEKGEKLMPKRVETTDVKPKDKFAERPLPEIAESIDAKPLDEDEFPEGPMTFEKNEFHLISSSNNKNQHNETSSVIVMTPKVEIRLGRDRKPQQIIGQNGRTNSLANVNNRAKNSTSEVIVPNIHRATNNQRSGQKIINSVTKIPSTPSSTTIIQRPLPTTTRRNFRKDNDYYSMYYDDGNGESNGGG